MAGRVELRNAKTAASLWRYDTAPLTTALSHDAAHRLTMAMAAAIDEHPTPRQTSLVESLKRLVGADARASSRMCSPWMGPRRSKPAFVSTTTSSTPAARDAFASAVHEEPRNALALAWLGRALLLTRDADGAVDAGDRALSFITPETPAPDALFVRAVAREARRAFIPAEEDYRALVAANPRDSMSVMELGAFLDRRERSAEAAQVYREALSLDTRLVRPRLELCRLYSPSRLNEPIEARKYGETALAGYRALAGEGQPSGGEGQSLLCLTDVLRWQQHRAE